MLDTRTRNILAREFNVHPEDVEGMRRSISSVIRSKVWNPRKCYDVGPATESKIHAWAGTQPDNNHPPTDQVFGVVVARMLDADECVRTRFNDMPPRTMIVIAEALKACRANTAPFRWIAKKRH